MDLSKLHRDVLSELCCALPSKYLFPNVHPILDKVCPQIHQVMSPNSLYRWRIVQAHTRVQRGRDLAGEEYTQWLVNMCVPGTF